MNEATIRNQKYDILGWFRFGEEYNLVLKKKNEDYYMYVSEGTLSWYKLDHLAKTLPIKKSELIFNNYIEENAYYLNEELAFYVVCDLEDSWIVRLLDRKNNNFIYECDNDKLIPINESLFLIKDISFFSDKKMKYKVKEFKTNKELSEVLDYEEDYMILKNLNAVLVQDFMGTLRFKKEKHSPASQMINLDLSKAKVHFYIDKIYTLKEMMIAYMQDGYSVNGFFEVYLEYFRTKDDKTMSEEMIRDVIEGKLDKRNRDY